MRCDAAVAPSGGRSPTRGATAATVRSRGTAPSASDGLECGSHHLRALEPKPARSYRLSSMRPDHRTDASLRNQTGSLSFNGQSLTTEGKTCFEIEVRFAFGEIDCTTVLVMDNVQGAQAEVPSAQCGGEIPAERRRCCVANTALPRNVLTTFRVARGGFRRAWRAARRGAPVQTSVRSGRAKNLQRSPPDGLRAPPPAGQFSLKYETKFIHG